MLDTFDYLKAICLGPDAYMSVFTAYIDESGTHSDASNVVVGGYISTVRNWKQLRREWNHLLKREGVAVLHRTDLENLRGEFKGWSEDRQISIIRESHKLIKQYTEKGIGAAVITADFDQVMPGVVKRIFGGPYGWVVHDFMVGVGRWARDSNQKGFVQYVFEQGARGRHQVERMFSTLYSPPPGLPPSNYDWRETLRINGWSFGSKYDDSKRRIQGIVQLQSADWFAYEIYKHMDNRVVDGARRPIRKSALDLFRPNVDVLHYWDSERLNKWVADMTVEGLIKVLEEREQALISAGFRNLI